MIKEDLRSETIAKAARDRRTPGTLTALFLGLHFTTH